MKRREGEKLTKTRSKEEGKWKSWNKKGRGKAKRGIEGEEGKGRVREKGEGTVDN